MFVTTLTDAQVALSHTQVAHLDRLANANAERALSTSTDFRWSLTAADPNVTIWIFEMKKIMWQLPKSRPDISWPVHQPSLPEQQQLVSTLLTLLSCARAGRRLSVIIQNNLKITPQAASNTDMPVITRCPQPLSLMQHTSFNADDHIASFVQSKVSSM